MDKTVVERISRFVDMGAILDYSSAQNFALVNPSRNLVNRQKLHDHP
jgi:hypothetical protein